MQSETDGTAAASDVPVRTGTSASASTQRRVPVLMFGYGYYPGTEFTIEAPLSTSTTVDVLNGPDDEGIPEISQPDEYNGYVTNLLLGTLPTYSFLFSRQPLQRDSRFLVTFEAQVLSSELNLLEVVLLRRDA